MNKRFIVKQISTAVVGAFLLAPLASMAADQKTAAMHDKVATGTATHDNMGYSDRARTKMSGNEKEALEAMLKPGQDKAYYTKAVTDAGYMITSVNADKADYVEYEIVKGSNSYELQVVLAGGKATKIDVSTNMWRTDATKAALRGNKTTAAAKYLPANDMYSDRAHMKTWSGEKEMLEKGLQLGQAKGYYADALKKMGYQVTSMNDNEKDYVEYEIVKAGNTYEVQVDFEAGKAKKVDVTTNVWQTEATERALAAYKKK